MPDVREFQPVLESAEKAAGMGDFVEAEALLRKAAALQEAALGPLHPDLASTFNNLAVACEMTHKPTDAEQFYRRAYAIAAAGLDPRHPLLATSRSNLADFCQARGVPLEDWARVGASQVPQTPAAPQVLPRTSPMSPATPTLQPVAPAVSSRRAFAAVVAVLAVLATLTVARLWLMPARGSDPPRADAPTTATLDPPVPAPAPVSAAVTPASLTPQAPSASQAATTASGASASADLRVVTATVCHTLTTDGAWRCEPAGPVSAPGRLSYYTRIASSQATRVRHRWYLGDRLRHEAALTVSANPGTGYRTFSRLTVSPGQWRVELLASGGAVLDETRFEVR